MNEVQVTLSTKVKTDEHGELGSVPDIEGHWVNVVTIDGAKYRGTVENNGRYSFTLDAYHTVSEGAYADKLVIRWDVVKSVRGDL